MYRLKLTYEIIARDAGDADKIRDSTDGPIAPEPLRVLGGVTCFGATRVIMFATEGANSAGWVAKVGVGSRAAGL